MGRDQLRLLALWALVRNTAEINQRQPSRSPVDNRPMIIEHRTMQWWAAVVLGIAVAGGCKEPNPRSCTDGTCTDPALPFCDADGVLGGEPNECIAVSCTPMEFATCRGDLAVTCNAAGTSYDLVACELGCDAASGGCRACEPNETACVNGIVSTCDANGAVVASEPCALGCFEDEPRCRKIDPSNNLADYLDLVANPPDLDLQSVRFDTGAGMVTDVTGAAIDVPSFVAANGDGPSIRVFVVSSLRLNNATATSSTDPDAMTGPAFAVVARKQIVIDGRLSVRGRAGGVKNAECRGGIGTYFETDSMWRAVASGGGGHATPGARGGDVGSLPGGAAGQSYGNDALVPLRGGCPSGGVDNAGTITLYGVSGGGAVQLSAGDRIEVRGIIDVRGETGTAEQAGNLGAAILGGGAGGGILLEAPIVTLGPDAKLIAKGGGGGSTGPSTTTDDTAAPDPGNVCPSTCPDGGNGAAPGIAAGAGQPAPSVTGTAIHSGGGGGGMGRVRINTRDTTYTKANTSVEAAAVTSGLIGTR